MKRRQMEKCGRQDESTPRNRLRACLLRNCYDLLFARAEARYGPEYDNAEVIKLLKETVLKPECREAKNRNPFEASRPRSSFREKPSCRFAACRPMTDEDSILSATVVYSISSRFAPPAFTDG